MFHHVDACFHPGKWTHGTSKPRWGVGILRVNRVGTTFTSPDKRARLHRHHNKPSSLPHPRFHLLHCRLASKGSRFIFLCLGVIVCACTLVHVCVSASTICVSEPACADCAYFEPFALCHLCELRWQWLSVAEAFDARQTMHPHTETG